MYRFANTDQNDAVFAVLGDAICSYMSHPDPSTSGSCLLSRERVDSKKRNQWTGLPKRWYPTQRRWASAASLRRQIVTYLIVLAVLIPGIIFIINTLKIIQDRAGSLAHVMDYAFGATDQYASALLGRELGQGGDANRYIFILFANVWQTGVSMIYIQVNALLTCMLVNKEWQQYGSKRKTLRVTHPVGAQRSTYFLSLPLRYALPMQALWILLHWALSQACYMFAVEDHWYGEALSESPFLAFSPWPSFTSVLLGICILIGITVISLRKDNGPLPVGAYCSAVISAACHPSSKDSDDHLSPLQWGSIPDSEYHKQYDSQNLGFEDEELSVKSLPQGQWNSWSQQYVRVDDYDRHQVFPKRNTKQPSIFREAESCFEGDSVGHCSFTAGPVQELVPGMIYA